MTPAAHDPISIEDVIASIPAWQGQSVEAEPVHGGITNRAYRVVVGGKPHFVSIPGAHAKLLAIARDQEAFNNRAAAETGISPRVLYELSESGVIVLEFVIGHTLTLADMKRPGMPERLASAVRRLHSARPFANDFDLFDLTRSYGEVLRERRFAPPEGFAGYAGLLAEIETAARRHALPPRPCSNDLVPENLIEDGERLWIVDFGYSGNNDPCSELGNACCEADYVDDDYLELCAAYFGQADEQRLARMHLYAIMSDVAWSLWSVIQENLSDLEFDFVKYGGRRWRRVRERLEADRLRQWLASA